MKAYELIWDLLKHPFGEVVFCGVYKITHTKYNRYLKHHTLESMTDEFVESESTEEVVKSSCDANMIGDKIWY